MANQLDYVIKYKQKGFEEYKRRWKWSWLKDMKKVFEYDRQR